MAKPEQAKAKEVDEAKVKEQKELKVKVNAFLDAFRALEKEHMFTFRAVLRGDDSSLRAEQSIVRVPEPPAEEEVKA